MKKYKIYRNRPEISEESVNKHKNFEKVLAKHNTLYNYKKATRPIYKDKKFGLLVILLAIILLVVIVDSAENPEKDSNAEKSDSSSVTMDSTIKK